MSAFDLPPIVGDDESVYYLPNYVPRPKPLPIPDVGIFDEPTLCLVINEKWAAHLLGVLEVLDQLDAWVGTEEEILDARDQIRAAIANFMMGVCMDPCCPETQDLLEITIEQNHFAEWQAVITQHNQWMQENTDQRQFNQMFYDGVPQSLAPRLIPDGNWNDETGGDGVLCEAIKNYVNQAIYDRTFEINQENMLLNGIYTASAAAGIAYALPTGGLSLGLTLGVGAAALVSNVALDAWNHSVQNVNARRKVVCCMYDHMKDQPISQEVFKTSCNDCSFDTGTDESNIAALVDGANQQDINYQAFLTAMNFAQQGDDGDCICNCDTALQLETLEDGSTLQPLGNCIYRFHQDTVDADGFKNYSFKDILGRCLLVEPAPSPFVLAPVSSCNVVGCCGDPDYVGTGGFATGKFASVRFKIGMVTYTGDHWYKITEFVC